MAGFENIYCIGGLGGYLGADGINPIYLQILVGYSDRMWLEPHYFDKGITPIGNIGSTIPADPDDPNMLIDATIAFAPAFFKKCKTLEVVKEILQDYRNLDFGNAKSIPVEWKLLREEAYPFFNELNIFSADLKPVDLK